MGGHIVYLLAINKNVPTVTQALNVIRTGLDRRCHWMFHSSWQDVLHMLTLK
jgi:hypothetical protein